MYININFFNLDDGKTAWKKTGKNTFSFNLNYVYTLISINFNK